MFMKVVVLFRHLLIALFFLLPPQVLWAAPNTVAIQGGQASEIDNKERPLGFSEWKLQRVDIAQKNLNDYRGQEALVDGGEPTERNKPMAELSQIDQEKLDQKANQLRRLEFNLEIAKGLTIHDYFALYLKDRNQQQMAEVVAQLNPQELSELLIAYREALFGERVVVDENIKK